jgi:hypothetical protein
MLMVLMMNSSRTRPMNAFVGDATEGDGVFHNRLPIGVGHISNQDVTLCDLSLEYVTGYYAEA